MEILDRILAPILADPIIVVLLVMLVGSLSVGAIAGKKADAQEKIQRRLKYVTNMRSSNNEQRINQSIADLLDEEDQRPSPVARLLGLLAPLASQLPLVGEKDREKLQKTLIVAGYRSSDAINLMLAAKMASGIVVGMVVYAAVTSGAEPMATGLRGFLSLPVGIVLGAMAPEFFVRWQAGRRQKKISQAIPDALDLMVICAEAGLTMETALHRVSRELKTANPELALELATTEAELKILPQRKTALENLVYRTEAPEMASLTVTMNQAEKYGTSLSQALRTIASEGRRTRMLRIEEKAARLPALMSLPLMVFVLPPCAVIVGGPAMVRLMGSLAG